MEREPLGGREREELGERERGEKKNESYSLAYREDTFAEMYQNDLK